mgnify:CR=1 FL=1
MDKLKKLGNERNDQKILDVVKMLEFEDNFFKVMAQRQFIYENAMRTGRQKGLNGDALAHHIAEFVTNPPANMFSQNERAVRQISP